MSITHYMITESSAQPLPEASGWIPVTTALSNIDINGSYTLSSGDGMKTVYIWIKDSAGNVSVGAGPSHFTVKLDTIKPVINLSAPAGWTKVDVKITAAIDDSQSGVAEKKWAPGKQLSDYFITGGTAIEGTAFAVSANDWYTVYAKDNAGNTAVNYINITDIDSIAPVASNIAAINCNGSIEAFWIVADGVRNLRKTGPDTWRVKNLGGSVKQIAAARNNDGTLELFAIDTNNKFYTNRQSGLYSDSWNGWVNRGGQRMKEISVSRNSDGRLEAFGIGSHGRTTPYHQWQNEPDKDETWTNSWKELSYIEVATRIASVVNSDGRLELFFNAGVVYHVWQQNPHGGPWSNRSDLLFVIGNISEISAVCNSDGRLEAFAIGPRNRLFNNWQKKPHSGPWSNWDDKISGKGAVKKISVACNSDGRLEVFGIGLDDCLYHICQTKPSSGPWSDWEKLGIQKVKAISAARNFSGRLEVFAIGSDDRIYHILQVKPSGAQWSAWEQIIPETATVGSGMTVTDKPGLVKHIKAKPVKKNSTKKAAAKKGKQAVKNVKAVSLKNKVKSKATAKKTSLKKIKSTAVIKKAIKKVVNKKASVITKKTAKAGKSKTVVAVKKSKPEINKKQGEKKDFKK